MCVFPATGGIQPKQVPVQNTPSSCTITTNCRVDQHKLEWEEAERPPSCTSCAVSRTTFASSSAPGIVISHITSIQLTRKRFCGSSVSKIFLYSFDFSDSDYICYKPTKLFIKNHLFHCTSHVGFNRDDDENPSHGRSKLLSSRTNSLVGIAADSRSFGTLNLVGLLAERASLREPGLSTRGLAQDRRTTGANYDALGMAEHGRDFVASGALDVHEVRVRMGHQALQLMLALLLGRKRVQEILGERHSDSFVFYTCSETRVLEA